MKRFVAPVPGPPATLGGVPLRRLPLVSVARHHPGRATSSAGSPSTRAPYPSTTPGRVEAGVRRSAREPPVPERVNVQSLSADPHPVYRACYRPATTRRLVARARVVDAVGPPLVRRGPPAATIDRASNTDQPQHAYIGSAPRARADAAERGVPDRFGRRAWARLAAPSLYRPVTDSAKAQISHETASTPASSAAATPGFRDPCLGSHAFDRRRFERVSTS